MLSDFDIISFQNLFQGKETEENWQARDVALNEIRSLLRQNPAALTVPYLKSILDPLTRSLHSLRTTIVLTSIAVVSDLSSFLPAQLDPHSEVIISNLLKLASNSKKLIAAGATSSLRSVFSHCSYHQKHLTLLQGGLADKNIMTRFAATHCLKVMVEHSHQKLLHLFEKTPGSWDIFEKCLKKALSDAHGQTREIARDTFYYVSNIWPDHARTIADSVELSVKKAIDRHPKPKPCPIYEAPFTMKGGLSKSESPLVPFSEKSSIEVNTGNLNVASAAEPITITPSQSPTNGAMSSSPPEISKQLSLLKQLSCEDDDMIIEGYQRLISKLKEHRQEKKAGAPLSFSETRSIKQKLLRLFSIHSSGTILATLFDPESLTILFESKMIAIDDILGPALVLKSSTVVSASVNVAATKFVDHVRSTHTLVEFLGLLVSLVNGHGMHKQRSKSDSAGDGSSCENIQLKSVMLVLESILNSPDEHIQTEVSCFLKDRATVRNLTFKLVPLFKSPDELAREIQMPIVLIFQRLIQENEHEVSKAFDSLEDSETLELRQTLGLKTNEVIESEELVSQSPTAESSERSNHVEVEQTSLPMEIELNDVSRMDIQESFVQNVLDETLPADFADVTLTGNDLTESRTSSPLEEVDHFSNVTDTPIKTSNLAFEPVSSAPLSRIIESIKVIDSAKQQNEAVPKKYQENAKLLINKQPSTPVARMSRTMKYPGLFDQSTPTPQRRKKTDLLEDYATLLSALSGGSASNSTMRRMIRISRETCVSKISSETEESIFWTRWFNETFSVLNKLLRSSRVERNLQENSLLYLKELIINQTCFMGDIALEVYHLLLDCRTSGMSQVAGAADDALETAIERFPKQWTFSSLLHLIDQWDLKDKTSPGLQVRPHPGFNFSLEYQPTPASSAFHCLGKACSSLSYEQLSDPDFQAHLSNCLYKGINSSVTDIRKSTVDCIVHLSRVLGDDVWNIIEGRFTDDQCKLTGVFIARAHRNAIQ